MVASTSQNHIFGPNESCRLGLCNPGQPLYFGGQNFQTPFDLGGTFTLDGRTFPIDAVSGMDRAFLRISFDAALVAPTDLSPGLVTLTAPFSLEGSFNWSDIFDNDPANPQLEFFGTGLLTGKFDYRNFEFPGQSQLFLHTARYDFAPTPEPATLLLLGTGLAGAFGLRRKLVN
jgi:hypothetical protein